MKILALSHQMSYTGAVIALANLCNALKLLGHQIVFWPFHHGPQVDIFLNFGFKRFNADLHSDEDFHLIIANTFATVPHALRWTRRPEKIFAWIHEEKYFFHCNHQTPESVGLQYLSHIAFPAQFQIEEFAYLKIKHVYHLPNGVLMQASRAANRLLPFADQAYWVCCGVWSQLKAQRDFVQVLKTLNLSVPIVFLGANKPPGAWSENFVFTGILPHQQAQTIISKSRGLISFSRSEVQPLSVIEAMMSQVPVLLSDISAHRELKALNNNIALFDLHHRDSFATGWVNLTDAWQNKALLTELKEIAQFEFGFEKFFQRVSHLTVLNSPND